MMDFSQEISPLLSQILLIFHFSYYMFFNDPTYYFLFKRLSIKLLLHCHTLVTQNNLQMFKIFIA